MTTLEDVRPKAVKAHECSACWGHIAPGETYHRVVFISWYGDLTVWKCCKACEDIRGLVAATVDHDADGFGHDEYLEWARDHEDDAEQGEAARAYLGRHNSFLPAVVSPVVRQQP